MIQNEEFIQEFVDEANSHLEKVEAALLNKSTQTGDPETINELFRAVHSIKGTAGFFGLKKIVTLAHAMENVFGEIRNGKMAITDGLEEVLLAANDGIKDLVDNVFTSEEQDVSGLVERVNALLEQDTAVQTETNAPLTVVDELKRNFSFVNGTRRMLEDGVKHGHHIYELKLRINRDLFNYGEGPVKLFKKIEALGTVIDTMTDISEITSLDDVLDAVNQRTKDVYLGILVTTVLERELFAEALGIVADRISVFKVDANNLPVTDISEELSEPEISLNHVELNPVGNPEPVKQLKIEDSIRVHVSILNDLLDMAGEMVLGRNQLLRTLENYRKTIPGLGPILQNIDRLTTGIQGKVMMTRMQPVANVFNKFPRIIREISKTLTKDIELVIEGEDVELDKSMIEGLADPLTHLVRNSADHGIESAEQRQAASKPRGGKITLRAYHEGGYVNIDIIDDGQGIDIEKVKKKALEKEVVSAGQLEKMTETDLLKLIFKPGLSTADQISDLSGRGVGMDVVKTNIERLGGSIEVYTSRGNGTTIRLMLPLTLAIIQSLIVKTSGHRFALPQVNLKEIVRIKEGESENRMEYLHDAAVLRLRGRLLPVIHLASVLGLSHSSDRPAEQAVTRVLVLKIGNRMFGLIVDAILESEETLVKPVPVYLKECDCYSGVTILGDGKTAMILDPEGIIRRSNLKFYDEKELNSDKKQNEEESVESQNLLLFNCSGNETFALDLSVVARVEEILSTDLEKVGEQEFIKFNGNSLRVIRPEDYLPVNRELKHKDKYYVIIPKLVNHPMGILIEKIQDNVTTRIQLNTENIQCEGVIGSAIYDHRLVLLINIYELFEKADPGHYLSNLEPVEDKRVLLVEDTQFFQRIEMKYLTGAGYDVIVAKNGREALEYLESDRFDIVISDIQMPVMDGLELIKKIRNNRELMHLPVIALTSMSDEATKKAILGNGFDYYEWKLDRDRLLHTMVQALQAPRRDQN